jgi:YD repeat-containing protein
MQYSEEVKGTLWNLIDEMSSDLSEFTVIPDKDFTRKKKWDFPTLIKFIISMESQSLKNELHKYFGYTTDCPTNASFNQRRAQIKSDAFKYLFEKFTVQYSKNHGIITIYNYDKNGNLTTESDGTQYTYDAFNQLVETDKQDGTWQQNVYDATGLRMATVEKGTYTGYTYDRDNILAEYNKDDNLTTRYIRGYDLISQKKDAGETYNYLHNAHGDITTEKNSQEYITLTGEPTVWNTISYTYDKNGNAKTVSDSNGGQVEYTYDAMGRVVQDKTLMEGSKYIINGNEYDKSGNLVKKWNEVNSQDLSEGGPGTVQAVTVMEYDKSGNLTKETSPEGYVTTYEYDDNDRLVAENKQVSEDTVTVKSNSLSMKSSKKTLYPGESYHFKLEMNVTGAVKGLDTEVKYDERLMEVVSANTDVEGLTIDTSTPGVIKLSAKNTKITDKTTLSNITMRIKEGFAGTAYIIPSGEGLWSDAKGQYNFNSLSGKLLSVKAPDMNNDGIVDVSDLTLTARADGTKQGDSSYDEKYDITGDDIVNDSDLDYIKDRIFDGDTMALHTVPTVKTAEKSTQGSYIKSSAIVTRTTTYEYDKEGNLIKETDCNGNSIQYDYDAYDRVIRVTDQDGNATRAFYDEEGNITKVVDPEHYDPKKDDGKGETYVYDTMGRLLDVYDASGTLVQKNTYDKDSLLTGLYDATGKALEYAYDIGGREISETTPKAKESGKVSQEYAYDAMGYITSTTDGNGNTTLYERDMWGRPLKVTDPIGVVTQCTYDNLGNPTSVADGKGNPTTYVYNTWNQLSAATDAQGLTKQYLYDREGNLTKETDRNGTTLCYTYNSDGNLTKVEVQGSKEYNEYLYNKDGSLLAAINNNTVDTYDYTPNGTVKSKARNGVTILYYLTDKNGNITRVTDANGDYTGYTYDAQGRLDTVTDGATVAATYTYNADSTIAGIKYSNGISTTYGYDSDKNITRLVSKKANGKTLDSYSYTYDNNGNQLTKKENGKTTTYAYDKLNRLARENETIYTYDNARNRLSKSAGTENVSYSYDQRNMLTQESKNGIITTLKLR